MAAQWGNTKVTKVLVEAGASLSAVDNKVIKPSVKLIQSNIKTIFKHKQFLIKSSQTTQHYTTKVFYKQFSCHSSSHKKSFFVTNLFKINIF
jgi:hypothetical protein